MGPLTWLFWMLVVMALSYAIGELTKKTPKIPSVEPNDLDIPTTEEGVKYTVVFGTCWIENSVIAWWGDVKTTAITRHYSVNKWFNNKRVYYTAGYHYAMGAHEILTQGQNDGIVQIYVGDTLAWPDASDKTVLQADGATSAVIDEPRLFGGEDAEGGVVGTVDFQYGASTQSPNSYLIGVLGANISASRGLTAAIKRQVRFGTTPYPKTWSYLVKRTNILTTGDPQWYAAKSAINTYDLNPAHVLRECYTDTEWGFRHSTGLFDETTWRAFADTLYSEGFGLSMKWEDQNQTLEEFVNDVLRHINAVVYRDPSTGFFVPKLIRDDYVVGDLEEFDDSDIESVSDFTRGAYRIVPNVVWLKYWNRLDNAPVSIPDHDLALINTQDNKLVNHEVSFLGVMNDALAGKLVSRERQQLGSFLAVMKLKGKRTMSHLRPGGVFKLTWPILGFSQMVVRILKINYGSLSNNKVSLDCVQDVFSVQTALYSTPPSSGWVQPGTTPAATTARLVGEAPFWDAYLDAGLSEALALDNNSGFLQVAARAPSEDSLDYELMLRDSPTSSFYSDGRGTFTPNGTLQSSLPLNAVTVEITLESVENIYDVEAGDYAVIENEIIKVTVVDAANDRVTIARGCLDTVPAAHAAGTRVWFAGTSSYIAGHEYTTSNQPGVKILPRTTKGQLADDTAYNSVAFNSRMDRPYPPGNFKINSVSYPATFSGQPTVSWAHRDRTQQLDGITEHAAAGVGPEVGVTYTLQIYDESDVLVRTETGIVGTSYAYSWEDELSDCGISSGGALNSSLRFVLKSVRAGRDSWQSYDLRVNRV